MPASLNAPSSVPRFTGVSVDPTQNRSVPSLLKRALLRPWSRARDRGGGATTRRPISEARNHPSQTGRNPNHHSSTAMAPSTSEGSSTATGSHRASPSTCAQSTGRLAQSHEQQGFDHCDPPRSAGKKHARQEEERNLGGKMVEKKMKKAPRFSKSKGEL